MAAKRNSVEGNREKLLRGALTCLRERGYARTTTRDLVAASGANLASIGYHYGSKEALLNEAIAVGFSQWVAQVEQSTFAAESASTPERLERSLSAMIDRFGELEPFLVTFVEAFPRRFAHLSCANASRSPTRRRDAPAPRWSYEQSRATG